MSFVFFDLHVTLYVSEEWIFVELLVSFFSTVAKLNHGSFCYFAYFFIVSQTLFETNCQLPFQIITVGTSSNLFCYRCIYNNNRCIYFVIKVSFNYSIFSFTFVLYLNYLFYLLLIVSSIHFICKMNPNSHDFWFNNMQSFGNSPSIPNQQNAPSFENASNIPNLNYNPKFQNSIFTSNPQNNQHFGNYPYLTPPYPYQHFSSQSNSSNVSWGSNG